MGVGHLGWELGRDHGGTFGGHQGQIRLGDVTRVCGTTTGTSLAISRIGCIAGTLLVVRHLIERDEGRLRQFGQPDFGRPRATDEPNPAD